MNLPRKKYKVAVVGATGNVGTELLSILAERNFPIAEITALASRESLGKDVSFGEKRILKIQELASFDFSGIDIAFFMAGAKIAKQYAAKAAKAGTIVIDNSAHFRMDPDVPLIIPEVNLKALDDYKKKNIIANPNCSTIQMLMALAPIHKVAPIKRIIVATYQSVSGAGRGAMDELFRQTRSIYVNDPIQKEHFPKQIAFNVIPHIDDFMEDGSTKEEWKMMVETKKILDPKIKLSATCVRVPVFNGHSEAIHIELSKPLSAQEARKLLTDAPGISVIDHRANEGYVTPVESAADDLVFVSRIREDISVENGLSLWVVSDNIRKGAALNAVQIAEAL